MTRGPGFLGVVFATVALLATGCGGEDDGTDIPPESMLKLTVPPAFSYDTVQDVAVEVVAKWPDGSPAPGIVVSVYSDEADPPGPDQRVARGLTGTDGTWSGVVSLPARMQSVPIGASIVGVPSTAVVAISGGRASVTFETAGQGG